MLTSMPTLLRSPLSVFNNLHSYLMTIYMHLRKLFFADTPHQLASSTSSSSKRGAPLAAAASGKQQQSATMTNSANLNLTTSNNGGNNKDAAAASSNLDNNANKSTHTKQTTNSTHNKQHFDDDTVSLGSSYESSKQASASSSSSALTSRALKTASMFPTLPHLRWRPTSEAELADVEASILSHIKRPFKQFFVEIGEFFGSKDNKMNTIELLTDFEIQQQQQHQNRSPAGATEQHQQQTTTPQQLTFVGGKQMAPLVLIHGFASGIGFWILNYDELAANKDGRKVYAFDILGFGRSSRPNFNLKENVEDQFVDSIEQWRQKMALDKMIILGHSFGGYLSANYALRHPDRVAALVLADPWGVSDQQNRAGLSNRVRMTLPFYVRTLTSIFQKFNPLAVLRVTGPYGPRLVHTFRTDLKEKFAPALYDESEKMLDYIYHCNAQNATGETAFKALTLPYGWAKNPIMHRLLEVDAAIPISFIYGSRSWIDRAPGEFVRERRAKVGFHVLNGAGHHVYADKSSEFNEIVLDICSKLEDA